MREGQSRDGKDRQLQKKMQHFLFRVHPSRRADTVKPLGPWLTVPRPMGKVSDMFSSVVKIYRHARLLNDFASSEAVFVASDATSLSAMLI